MTWRFRLILFLIFFSFLVVIARLFYWQVVKASFLKDLGESQYGRVVTSLSPRGEIETSDGFPIASNKITYSIFANPKEIKDKEKVANELSSILSEDSASISAQLSQDLFWTSIATSVEPEVKDKIQKLNIQGVGFTQEFSRFYPEGSMSAHLLGFVGKDENGGNKGYFGLEGFYDKLLRGKEKTEIQVYDALGRPILAKLDNGETSQNGETLVLSLDRSIQFMVEQELKKGIEAYGAAGGMVGIMNPKTGEIIAMAAFPSFDPKNYSEFPSENYKNPFISNLYEPGSTFKPIIMSSALNEGKIIPTTVCNICSGPVPIGGYSIKTWNDHYFPGTNMIQVIQHSDNTGMVFVGEKLGLDGLLKYFKRFGIGQTSGIDLQGEVAPDVKPRDSWYAVDLATASFGQGISITPIELLTAFSAIANKGQMMEPHMVSQVVSSDGKIVKIAPKEISQPISESTAKVMTEILVNAVDNGEAKWTSIKDYRVAGKTGTASIPVAGHYDPNQTIASFIGYAPAEDPKFLMLVIFDRPTSSIYGAETAAPVFFNIARDLFTYYKIPPDR